MMTNSNSTIYNLENRLDSLKLTIQRRKRWGRLVLSFIDWVIVGLGILPIFGLVIGFQLTKYLPGYVMVLVWILILGISIYLVYVKFLEVIRYAFDKEIIEINHQTFSIMKSGLGFNSRMEFPSENIKGITVSYAFIKPINLLLRISFSSSEADALILWKRHGVRNFYMFGKSLSQPDAQSILNTILDKFPQYRYSTNS